MTSEVTKLTSDLIAIPSVNPQDETMNEPPYGETAMADYVFNWLRQHGLDVQADAVEPDRSNILAVAEGAQTDQTLLVCAHMDTVDVQDMTIDPFTPTIADGRLYGRGSSDDKGPLAALMIAFRDRVRKGNLPCNLAFLASCGEEYNLLGARHCARTMGRQLTAAIMAEPTDHKVVVAHKGVIRVSLTCSGKSAHSSTPQLGENAVYRMARVLLAIESFGQNLAARPPHPQLNTETLSATIVQGGRQINVIPDRCETRIDWRLLPGRTPEQCKSELADYLKTNLPAIPVTLETINQYESMETDASAPIVANLLHAAGKVTASPEAIVVGYATDASAFSHLNIPTPVFGPGHAAQAHTQDEFIDIAELEKGLAAYSHFFATNWLTV